MAVADRRDYPLLARYRWHLHYDKYGNTSPRAFCGKTQRYVYMRHIIAEAAHGPKPEGDYVCEHISGDLMDCQRDNVRWIERMNTEWRKEKRAERASIKAASADPLAGY